MGEDFGKLKRKVRNVERCSSLGVQRTDRRRQTRMRRPSFQGHMPRNPSEGKASSNPRTIRGTDLLRS